MRLLFVTPQLPWPATQGTALRNFHLLQIAASAHQVDLLTFGPFPEEGCAPDLEGSAGPDLEGGAGPGERIAGPLRRLCRQIEVVAPPRRRWHDRLRDLALGRADMEGRLWSATFAARLRALLRAHDYDAVQLEGFEMAGYLLGPAALRAEAAGALAAGSGVAWSAGRRGPKLIFDDHNAEYVLQQSAAAVDRRHPRRWPRALYSAVQAARLRRREALYAAAADLTLAVSAEDAAALETIVPGLGAVVVPNGVDCAAFPPPEPAPVPTLFFAGKLDYRPNVDACEWLVREILPRVRRQVPEVRVVLAGRDPAPAVRALAGPGIEITGALEAGELLRQEAAAWVYVVPVRMGGGVRFKALEAMAAGVPLVATTLGAAGTGAVDGEHALIADDAGALARAIVRLLQRPDERARLAAAARALAMARHDWRHVAPRLLEAYETLYAAPRRRVSVVATVLNERQSVPLLLDSLASQTRPADEVVIADGGSKDGTLELLKRYEKGMEPAGVGGAAPAPLACLGRDEQGMEPASCPPPDRAGSQSAGGERRYERCSDEDSGGSPAEPAPAARAGRLRVLSLPGANIAQGRNAAIQAASAGVLAVTDAGVTLDPAWLERLVAPLERDEAGCLDGVSGFFVPAPQSTWELALGATTLPEAGEVDPARFLPSSRSLAVRRAAWQAAGGYPEWLDYCEDLLFDFALRARGARLRFAPRALVYFRPRSSPRAFFRQYYQYARGDGKAGIYARRHAIRYGSYALGALLACSATCSRSGRRQWSALLLLMAGGVLYLRRPLVRLAHQSGSAAVFWRAAPLVPLVRVIGDVAKMLGYPVGLVWRLRHRRERPAG